MPDLLPTFTCFDDAIEYIEMRVKEDRSAAPHLRLVHALCEHESGVTYAHAWAEERGRCWSAALAEGQKVFFAVKTLEFYRWKRVRQRTVYTVPQLVEQNYRHGTYGPWEARYIEACGQGERRVLGATPVRGPKTVRSGRPS